MPVYVVEALDFNGNKVREEIEAVTLEELFETVERKGLILLKYRKKYLTFLQRGKITRKELAEFLQNLSFMLKSGIPLVTALEDLISEIKNSAFLRKLRKILAEVHTGSPFYEAVERAKLFPPIVNSLIRIGEESGTLDQTLTQASEHLYRIDEIISQTKRAITYPAFVLISMSIAFGFWFFYVLPRILKLFKDMNLKLPETTLVLLAVTNFLNNYGIFIGLGLILSIIGIILAYKNPKTQYYVEIVWLKIPLFGRVKRLNFLSFFFEFFSILLISGVDLLRSLEIIESTFSTALFKRIIQEIKQDITAGETISASLAKHKIFRRLDLRVVSVGETTGRLPEQFKFLADFYYLEVQKIVDNLTKILEPVLLIVSGIIFFLIIVSLLLPVYNLISKIGTM